MDHEGMSHAGCGGGVEKNKEKILFFVRAESHGSSKLFASAESSHSAGRRVLLGLG